MGLMPPELARMEAQLDQKDIQVLWLMELVRRRAESGITGVSDIEVARILGISESEALWRLQRLSAVGAARQDP
jgi:hypothetical protein